MRTKPVVSIIVPCYCASGTIVRALGSLMAQTAGDFECIIVDDGSTDNTAEIVRSLGLDERFRCITFENNRGRPIARQAGLDAARGDYLAMLDADDWWYPQKLEIQLRSAQEFPKEVVIGCGMAIEDSHGRLVGVRGHSGAAGSSAFSRFGPPPVAHAPSLIQMEVAKMYGYAKQLKRGQDADFLISVLWGRSFVNLPDVLYSYSEYSGETSSRIVSSHLYGARVYWKHRWKDPLRAAYWGGRALVAAGIGLAASKMRLESAVLARRSQPPSGEDLLTHETAWSQVKKKIESLGWPV